MDKKKQTTYSIQDAFKSLSMLDDSEFVVEEESDNTNTRKVLSEDIQEVKSDDDKEETLDMDAVDAEIEAFNNNLRKLKEKYDKNSKSLTADELKQLKESGIVEELKPETVINEEQKINIGDKEQVEQGLADLNKEQEEDEVEMVVDVEAETTDELKDSYIGDYIIQCPVCKTLVYKAEEEIVHSEEDDSIVNVEEPCPHCKSEDGYTIVGKVAPVGKVDDEEESEEEKDASEEDKEESEKKDSEKEDEEEKEESKKDEKSEDEEEEEDTQKESLEKPQLDLEDLNEELFNRLATKYLNNIYENVDSFVTESGEIEEDTNKVILEGTINFKSGKKLATKFVFEVKSLTKKGRVRFVGMNESLSSSKRTYTLIGRIIDKVLMSESLTYNYSVKVNEELKRIYGRVTEDLSSYKK